MDCLSVRFLGAEMFSENNTFIMQTFNLYRYIVRRENHNEKYS